ncbi:hypothetical protein HGE1_01645 [Anaplasma phagocytophilum str. HGE1]|nr:hypothetical protein WSQ_01765 [Anaplasma phagocytophilum str. JM]AGR81789.1 hypothetical protein YYY_01780 [Anaplasma phagocytophilum str. Dog2]EOA61936.1 hypothetical protein HGE1_01645 [Anaplasma phagocytophilum str. HGE1]PLC10163.1 hypothetical protein C0V68_02640 [Anaplasma phagocytophilum]
MYSAHPGISQSICIVVSRAVVMMYTNLIVIYLLYIYESSTSKCVSKKIFQLWKTFIIDLKRYLCVRAYLLCIAKVRAW